MILLPALMPSLLILTSPTFKPSLVKVFVPALNPSSFITLSPIVIEPPVKTKSLFRLTLILPFSALTVMLSSPTISTASPSFLVTVPPVAWIANPLLMRSSFVVSILLFKVSFASFNWLTLTASLSATPLSTLETTLLPALIPSELIITSPILILSATKSATVVKVTSAPFWMTFIFLPAINFTCVSEAIFLISAPSLSPVSTLSVVNFQPL